MNSENIVRDNFVMNAAFREPYIHRTKRGYNKYAKSANPARMESQALKLYKEQSNRLKQTFQRNEMPDKDLEEASKALKTIEELLNGLTNQGASQMNSANVFKENSYKVNGNSFWNYSQSAEKREELFEKDSTNLLEYAKGLDSALEAFGGISRSQKELIEALVKSKGIRIPSGNAFSALGSIYAENKSDKGIKTLVAANLLLKNKVGLLKPEEAQGVPSIDDDEAREIVKGLSGSLNGLKGGFFEVAVESLLNNAGKEFMSFLDKDPDIKITGAGMKGDNSIRTKSLGGKMVTSKTDVEVKGQIGNSSAEFNFGISLKTSTLNSITRKRVTTIHSGNLGNLLTRANSLIEESTYHLFNSAVHYGTTDAIYRAAKMKSTAMLAFDAIAGLGTRKDTSYFIMYTDKVIGISDFLEDISSGSEIPFNMNIAGVEGAANEAKKLRKGNSQVEKYIRSRSALQYFLSLKATLKSSSSK